MTRYLVLVAGLVLLMGGMCLGQTLEQILAQTGLKSDLVAMLTVEEGGQKLLLVFVYIDERTLRSNIRPALATAISPYVGKNALLVWAYSEAGATFDPGAIWIAQGDSFIHLTSDAVVPVEGDFLSGVVPATSPVAAVVVLGDAVDPAQAFELHYGDLAMATMSVNVGETMAQAEAASQAQASAEAQAEATAQGSAGESEPCGPCAEPCSCDPCAWLSHWWTSCCSEPACAPCEPCASGFIVPFLLLLLLGL